MKKQTIPKPRKNAWFVAVRGSYLPASWQGWASYMPFLAFTIGVTIYATSRYGSGPEMLLYVFPQWVSAAVIMTWLAQSKS